MKNVKILYITVFAITALLFALFEAEVIPAALIPDSPTTTYAIDLAAILTAVGGCFLLLYCFRIPSIRSRVEQPDAEAAEHCYATVCKYRLIVWFLLILLNIILYYEASFANNPKYGILILFIAGIFCWPSDAPVSRKP